MIRSSPLETVAVAMLTCVFRILVFVSIASAGSLIPFLIDSDGSVYDLQTFVLFPIGPFLGVFYWAVVNPILLVPAFVAMFCLFYAFYRYITTTESIRSLFLAFSICYGISFTLVVELDPYYFSELFTSTLALLAYMALLKIYLEWPWLQDQLANEREIA